MMRFSAVYYEPDSLRYPLGLRLYEQYKDLPWLPIDSHNRIESLMRQENKAFARLKRCLVVGIRKTHTYRENRKISDYLVPFTSSGCTAMCLYCYLVCHYNKCAYLRIFVNREQMLERLLRKSRQTPRPCVFEIGSNSDLVLENTITHNLEWVIPAFARDGVGQLTFPTKFSMVEPLIGLPHGGKTIFRMSVNPEWVIRKIELGTSPLRERIRAVNRMYRAGYPVGILIAPVVLTDDWKSMYAGLFDTLSAELDEQVKTDMRVEIIFMTYSFVHRAINAEAFPNAPALFDPRLMTGRGKGKYAYGQPVREEAEAFLREQLDRKLPGTTLVYIS